METHAARRRWQKAVLVVGLAGAAMVAAPAAAQPLASGGPAQVVSNGVLTVDPDQKESERKKREEQRKPKEGKCILGDYQKRFISARINAWRDESYVRVTFQSELCFSHGRWDTSDEPKLEGLTAGSMQGIGLDLAAKRRLRSKEGVEWYGRLRKCVPLSVGYAGVSFTGTGCHTIGHATIRVSVINGRLVYDWLTTTPPDLGYELVWTEKVLN